MKTKVVLITITVFLIFFLAGCGTSQAEYSRVNTQLRTSQTQLAELQTKYNAVSTQLRASQAQAAELQTKYDNLSKASLSLAAELQSQINELKSQYELVGETPTETAENIVKRYHETHVYSEYDFFVCSDMALDVWDMLKAQGIDAIIQIGNVETGAENITDADHAWVLAEVSPAIYLALEPTGGYAVWKADNPLYYEGYSFDNPKEYKRFVELKQEFNVRTSIIEQLVTRLQKTYEDYQELLNKFNRTYVGHPVSLESQTQLAIVKEKEGRCNELTELVGEQLKEVENISSEMKGLIQ